MEQSQHNNTLQQKQEKLLTLASQRLNSADLDLIKQSCQYASQIYGDATRKSGEPYMLHPVKVAITAIRELGLARNAIIASILHDLYDFKEFKEEEVTAKFGDKVLEIIRGIHKISGLYSHNITLQNQNYINLILNIVTDVRIILLKLADRLQNMRNISNFTTEKQQSLAEEIGALYAPIAHRLGLYLIKTEMEDFWLRMTHPGAYNNILNQIEKQSASLERYISRFTNPIKKDLDALNYLYEMKSRVKSVFSIWNKMEKQNVVFDEIYDFFAIRIILDNIDREREKAECWNVYSIITNRYKPNPKRLRDWISAPKSSGYESLHTTVQGPDKRWVEVQIRTRRMNDDAEKGQAAHWKYKETGKANRHDEWLAQVREVLESPNRNEEEVTVENKPEDYSPYVFVFTPAGDIKKLPRGATIIDFAYSIHSKVGEQCTGARINGKIVPIRYKLHNGQTAEVLTSKKQKPNDSWLSIAVSSRVKNRIKRSLREARYQEAELGKEELQRKLKQLNLNEDEDYILRLLKHYKMDSAVDLYLAFARDNIDFQTIREICLNKPHHEEHTPESIVKKPQTPKKTDDDYLVIGDDISKVNYHLAKCCNPVFGDKIFGFVSVAKGIVIHRHQCPNAARLKQQYPYRIINAKWNDTTNKKHFMTDVRIVGVDRMGVLNQISKVFADEMNINIQAMNITAHQGIYEAIITFNVRDSEHLNYLLRQLEQNKFVLQAERLDTTGQ